MKKRVYLDWNLAVSREEYRRRPNEVYEVTFDLSTSPPTVSLWDETYRVNKYLAAKAATHAQVEMVIYDGEIYRVHPRYLEPLFP